MTRTLKLFTIMLGLGLGAAPAYAGACKVYAFGDSLSDTGAASGYSAFTMSAGMEPPSAPPAIEPQPGAAIAPPEGFYWNGRYSDNRVWVEYLKEMICSDGEQVSFARGGAYSDDRNANEDVGVSGGLHTQVFEDLTVAEFAPGDAVTVWAFSNNVVFDLLMVDPVQAVQDVTAAVQELARRGAKRILVLNAPAIGDTPYGAFLVQQGLAFPGLPNNLNARVTQYNNMLRIALAGLNGRLDANVVHLDISALFRSILANPDIYGFVNVTYPCMVQDETRVRVLTGVCPVVDGPGGLALDATGAAFFDLLHPTTEVHRLIAAYASGALGAAAPALVASAP